MTKNKLLSPAAFRRMIYTHYKKYGRSFPWRETTNPYHIVISEVMLQQTQAERVVAFYENFIALFPSFAALAAAPLPKLLRAWQGLGYNRRALMLKKLAMTVTRHYKGALPTSTELLDALPGIGPATAASIAAFAFNSPTVFIETNIRSVYLHHFFKDKANVADEDLLPLIVATLDRRNPRRWYNALMDYGTMLKKTNPNPSRQSKHHHKQTVFKGSLRQIRGTVIKYCLAESRLTAKNIPILAKKWQTTPAVLKKILDSLTTEGFLCKKGSNWQIKP